jgi:hypothetical protein
MCTDYKDVAAAAVADAMSVIYEATSLDPGSMVAVRLTNTLFMETIIALEEMDDDEAWPEDYNPEAN